ncbi:cyclase family protein [Vibrio neonatus]|uniref:cyclase family protein n=1 Tax=Vibrio neonatus TaxID=278860 RepID=UPI0021C44143|nr:cyclase family protein [Vibrio neonatus]
MTSIFEGKVIIDLSHPIGSQSPQWPYFPQPEITRAHGLAKSGVLTQFFKMPMHCGTHADSPRHVIETEFDGRRARYTHEMELDSYCGKAVCLDLSHLPQWSLIKAEDMDAAVEAVEGLEFADLKDMIVIIYTGMCKLWDDSKQYYHYATGVGASVGHWCMKHDIKALGVDQQALDHPLHTSIGEKSAGRLSMNLEGYSGYPLKKEFIEKFGEAEYAHFDRDMYKEIHGEEAYKELYGMVEEKGLSNGTWEPCHKLLLGNGKVGWENVGGQVEKVKGRRFDIVGAPLNLYCGDGSMTRLMAVIDADKVVDCPDRLYPYGDH